MKCVRYEFKKERYNSLMGKIFGGYKPTLNTITVYGFYDIPELCFTLSHEYIHYLLCEECDNNTSAYFDDIEEVAYCNDYIGGTKYIGVEDNIVVEKGEGNYV